MALCTAKIGVNLSKTLHTRLSEIHTLNLRHKKNTGEREAILPLAGLNLNFSTFMCLSLVSAKIVSDNHNFFSKDSYWR